MKTKKYNLKRVLMRGKNLFLIHKIVFEKTYYPECERKKVCVRFFDNFIWVMKYGELNSFYNMWGFDVKTKKNINDYIDRFSVKIDRDRMNKTYDNYSYICLLRDKYLFSKYLKSNGISVANNIAIIVDGKIYDDSFNLINDSSKIFNKDLFIKKIDGECANGVFYIQNYQEYKQKEKILSNGMYIIQEKIIQHDDLSRIYNKSVNTIRILTIQNKDNIEVLFAGLRVGTEKSGCVDNWAAGGLFVEINNDGTLTKYGFAKQKYGGGRMEFHPDTKAIFDGYKVPFYNDVVKLVTKAHKTLYGICSIGWDVAITPTGPVLIEGNDNWEIGFMQLNHGLKKRWNSLIKKI